MHEIGDWEKTCLFTSRELVLKFISKQSKKT